MKRIWLELAAQLVALVVLFLVIAIGALFFGATIGAAANAMATGFHLQMADRLGLVCPGPRPGALSPYLRKPVVSG